MTSKVKRKKVVWTEIEDFYLTSKVMDFNDEELGKKLNKTAKQVAKRLVDLGIDVDKLVKDSKRQRALSGLAVGSANNKNNNIVSMTEQAASFETKLAPAKQFDKFRTDNQRD